MEQENHKICSFCGKQIKDNELAIVGNNGYVCADCAKLMQRVLDENKEQAEKRDITQLPKPHEIKAFLDEYVIGQDEAKIKIAVAVYNHYKRVWGQSIGDDIEIQKSNALLLGSTGTGKCICGDTFITVRNKKTNNIQTITINDFIKKINNDK